MSFKASCPHCEAVFNAPDGSTGRKAKCPKCGEAIVVTPAIVSDSTVTTDSYGSVPPLPEGVVSSTENTEEPDTGKTTFGSYRGTTKRGDRTFKSHGGNVTFGTVVTTISILLLLISITMFDGSQTVLQQIISTLLGIIGSMGICTGLILSKLNQILNAIKDASNID